MYREIHDTGIEERAHAPAIPRLLAAWKELRERYGYVPFDRFDPVELGQEAEDLIVLVPLGDDDYVCVHQGEAIRRMVGVDMTGRCTSDVKGPLGAFFREAYARVLAANVALFSLHRGAQSSEVHLWERLLLPCRDSDGSPVIVVYSKPRELRDDLLSAILNASLDGILAVRLTRGPDGKAHDGELIAANRRAAQFLGRPLEDLAEASLMDVFPDVGPTGIWERCVAAAETRASGQFVVAHRGPAGDLWLEVAVAPLGDGFMLNLADITERKQAEHAAELRQLEFAAANQALKSEIARRQALEAELSRLATLDALTGVLNRRALTENLQKALALGERYAHSISVLLLDLDHFKVINDTFGHAGGDAVLKEVAASLAFGMREEVDVVGRLGGEEFAVVLPFIGLHEAAGVAERVRQTIAGREIVHDGRLIHCTGSFGIASWDGREPMDRLLSRADHALYRAKAAGRNMVCVDEGQGPEPGEDGNLVGASDVVAFEPRTRRRPRPRRARDLT